MVIYRKGADPEALAASSGRLRDSAGEVTRVAETAGRAVDELRSTWNGADLGRLVSEWQAHRRLLDQAAQQLQEMSRVVQRNADAQRSASGTSGGPGGSSDQARGTPGLKGFTGGPDGAFMLPASLGAQNETPAGKVDHPGQRALDRAIARGDLPEETRGMNAAELSVYLKNHRHEMHGITWPSGPPGSVEDTLARANGILPKDRNFSSVDDVPVSDRTQVRAFFDSMPKEDQQLLAVLYPDRVGNLHGVPFDVRATANRISAIDVANMTTDPDVGDPRKHKFYEGIVSSIGTPHERMVVAFDPDKDVYAEVQGWWGPTTKNVGVVIPGTGTTMGALEGNNATYAQFIGSAKQGELAMVTFMPGHLPEELATDAPDPQYSQDNAWTVVAFSHDLRQETTHMGGTDAPKVTFAGHSYGGAVVGLSDAQGLDADRVLHVESAGMGNGVHGSDDLHPTNPSERRYAMLAPGDPIGYSQGVEVGNVGHGDSPAGFPGVTRLATGQYADGSMVEGSDAHGGVFTYGSDSYKNMLQVFTGGEITEQTDEAHESITGVVTPPKTQLVDIP